MNAQRSAPFRRRIIWRANKYTLSPDAVLANRKFKKWCACTFLIKFASGHPNAARGGHRRGHAAHLQTPRNLIEVSAFWATFSQQGRKKNEFEDTAAANSGLTLERDDRAKILPTKIRNFGRKGFGNLAARIARSGSRGIHGGASKGAR